jgi:streptomycin 6-kinase
VRGACRRDGVRSRKEQVDGSANSGAKGLVMMDVRQDSALMARMHEHQRAWSVAAERIEETASSVLLFGRRGGDDVVLKVVRAPGDEWDAGSVLVALGEGGVVRVHEHVPGAVLMERLRPGTALVDLVRNGFDREATDFLAGVIADMPPEPPARSHVTVEDWGRGFDRVPAPALPAGEALHVRAREMYLRLAATATKRRLLHGDLQHYNILQDERRGWVAIDPKGVVGELEYELGAALRNPVECPDVFANRAVIERRVAQYTGRLGVHGGRVLAWAFAQGVLSAIWSVEDGEEVTASHAGLLLARSTCPGRAAR